MTTRTAGLIADLDAHRQTLHDAVFSVPADARQRRPAADRWSVAEILEHLAIVEQRVGRLLSDRVAEAKMAGRAVAHDLAKPGSSSLPYSGRLDPARLADRSRRVKTGEASEPTGKLDAVEAWALLESARIFVRDLLVAHDALELGDVAHPHPFFGPLNFYEWIAFLAAHDGRHAAQVREVAEALATETRR